MYTKSLPSKCQAMRRWTKLKSTTSADIPSQEEDVSEVAAPEFQFINTVGSARKVSSKDMSIVRKHVMKKYHKDKVRDTSKQLVGDPSIERILAPRIQKHGSSLGSSLNRVKPQSKSPSHSSVSQHSAGRQSTLGSADFQLQHHLPRSRQAPSRQVLPRSPSGQEVLINELNARNRQASSNSMFPADLKISSRTLQAIHSCKYIDLPQ